MARARPLNLDRPNTAVADALLQADVLLCCGEDVPALLSAVSRIHGRRPLEGHAFRCYGFWRFEAFSLISSGIGTGGLEPLLCEVLPAGIVRRIVLVGTAGILRPGAAEPGRACLVHRALAASTALGLSTRDVQVPRCRAGFPGPGVPCCPAVSTDLYYGFSTGNDPRTRALQAADPRLRSAVRALAGKAALVDMETAQFYHLCRVLGDPGLEYLALRSGANAVGAHEEQIPATPRALAACIASALDYFHGDP